MGKGKKSNGSYDIVTKKELEEDGILATPLSDFLDKEVIITGAEITTFLNAEQKEKRRCILNIVDTEDNNEHTVFTMSNIVMDSLIVPLLNAKIFEKNKAYKTTFSKKGRSFSWV